MEPRANPARWRIWPLVKARNSSPNGSSDRLLQALLFEAGEAWEHFRHLENLSSQFLAIYDGVVVAYLGIMGLVFSRSGHDALASSLMIAAVTGPLIGTIGVAILGRLEFNRFVRNFYYDKVMMPIRAYIFEHLAPDATRCWDTELDIIPRIMQFQEDVRAERRVRGIRLFLHSGDRAFVILPLVCLGAPLYSLVASAWVHLSLVEYCVAGMLSVYTFFPIAVVLDLDRLKGKGLFGDRHLINSKKRRPRVARGL